MKFVAVKEVGPQTRSHVETVVVSGKQYDYLGRLARELNPDMPMAFAGAHIVRTLLERFEESGIDLAEASNEEELTHVAARCLRERKTGRGD